MFSKRDLTQRDWVEIINQLVSQEDRKDLIQELYLKLFEWNEKFPDPVPLKWSMQASQSAIKNWGRSQWRRKRKVSGLADLPEGQTAKIERELYGESGDDPEDPE